MAKIGAFLAAAAYVNIMLPQTAVWRIDMHKSDLCQRF
jgi:hypothetical protein